MFAQLRASVEAGVPDDALAIFLSEGGELSETNANVYFRLPNSNNESPKALLWWYINDSFHCGRLLDERHYKLALQNATQEAPMSIELPSAPETILFEEPVVVPKRFFYFSPEDEESQGLKAKIKAFGEGVIEYLPSEEESSSTNSLIVISKYQKFPKFSQVYSPFYLARMIDSSRQSERLLLGPCDCALDKPCPISGVEPKRLFTLSGFKGEERAKLQVMISLMGSRYSDYLTPATDFLIAKKGARPSPKSKAAANWSISIMDEDWLEQSFKSWTWLPIK